MDAKKKPPSHPHTLTKYIPFVRVLLLITIALAGIVSSSLSYYFIRKDQTQHEKDHFEGLVHDHFRGVHSSFNQQLQANIQVATLLGWACPLASDWPNCAISSKQFESLTRPLSSMTQIPLFVVAPIVRPNNRHSFEEFAMNYFETDGGFPNGTGWSDFGFGIFDYDQENNRTQSLNHTDPGTSVHDILVPVLYSSLISADYYLANTYTDPVFQPPIDKVLECVNQSATINCSSITDFIPTQLSKVSSIVTPIFPARQPKTIVGFSGALFSWEFFLSISKTRDFNFQCSIQSSTSPTVRTYSIKSGIAEESPGIAYYPPSTDKFWRQSKHSFTLDPDGIVSSDMQYTITYYSSNDDPSKIFAVIASISCIGITLLISIIFSGFNTLMEREERETNLLLESKRAFVRFISHEIRTPLNTISLSIRLVSEHLMTLKNIQESLNLDTESISEITKLIVECLEIVDDLNESSAVAVTTLNDLINYDKIETKTFTIEEKDVKIWSLLEKTVNPMILQAKEKNIHLKCINQVSDPLQFSNEDLNFDLKNLRVIGDSIKLAQVIRNLVSNALKFTPRNGDVTISAHYQPIEIPVTTPSRHFISKNRSNSSSYLDTILAEIPIGHVIITVSDSGPGLSTEQQLALFHQGVQFNANQLQAGQGSGLGLWISKEIVKLHHGHIRVKSEGLGCGSTFEVKLPVVLREIPLNSEAKCSATYPRLNETPTSGNGALGHILVVDDAASNRKILSRLLKAKGFICHEAENGKECVEMVMAAEYPYEFILLDSEMPVLNGPSAARQLRDQKCDILIIGVTGNVLPEDKAHFISQGADMVMAKPLDIDTLLSELPRYQNSKV